MTKIITHSAEETTHAGYLLGKRLSQKSTGGSVVCFYGDLAAGKTTFIKGLVRGATGLAEENVTSPTFVYLGIYQNSQDKNSLAVFHFDLYRLQNSDEFLRMGFDEYFSTEHGICCIEWAERIHDLLPADSIIVRMEHSTESSRDDERQITILEIPQT